jgi:hypothetical protein
MPTEGAVNKVVVISAVAVASFVATTLYLQRLNRSEPEAATTSAVTGRVFSATDNRDPAVDAVVVGNEPNKVATRVALIESPQQPADEDIAAERKHLAEYVGGIRNVAPVTADQERAILEAKLRHKAAYQTALRDSGFLRETLSTAERGYAHRVVARALNDYKENFLLEVKPVLNDEQFTLLSNYEATEFQRELERLQTAINAK